MALGTLRAEVSEGTPSSMTITILDDDEARDDYPPVVQPPSGGGGGRGVCDRVDLVVENLEVEEPEEKTSIRIMLPYNEPPFDTSTIIRCARPIISYRRLSSDLHFHRLGLLGVWRAVLLLWNVDAAKLERGVNLLAERFIQPVVDRKH